MLDAYIIDRIQQEKLERARRDNQLPLHIEAPRPLREPERQTEQDAPSERGTVVIDFLV